MGIDYGTKRVGIALSDGSNAFALPHKVLPNSKNSVTLLDEINEIVCEHEVKTIIVGESKDFKGEDNKVMEKIREFKATLENKFQMPVIFEPEFLTSHAAEQFQGKNDMHDASAAALILQSYLDRLKNTDKQ